MTQEEIAKIKSQAICVLEAIKGSKGIVSPKHTMLYLMCDNVVDLCNELQIHVTKKGGEE